MLSAFLVIHFWIVGYAAVSFLHTQRDLIRNFLIAPAVGVAVTLYSIYFLSRLGLPVGEFSWPLTLSLLVCAAGLIAWRRPRFAGWRAAPFVGVAILALLTSGWPLSTNGFAWLADSNPDFTFYVMNAHRLLNGGYFELPDLERWASQSDWTGYFAAYPAAGIRSGSDLLLAWTISLSQRNGLEIYMPLTVAFHVALVAIVPALIATPYRRARVLTGFVAATSAMLSLGVTLQLIAQILGLLFTSLACVLCLWPFYRTGHKALIRFIALVSLVMAAFILAYPEMLPFFGIPFLIYHTLGAREGMRFWRKAVLSCAVIGLLSFALPMLDVWGLLSFLLSQFETAGAQNRLPELFPYFLIPSGIAGLWGLSHYVPVENASLVITVFLAAAMTVFTASSALWLAWQREPAAIVLVVMGVVASGLFAQSSGFGMLKLAMYSQPFLLATFVSSMARLSRVRP
jgi:hypothetical protein